MQINLVGMYYYLATKWTKYKKAETTMCLQECEKYIAIRTIDYNLCEDLAFLSFSYHGILIKVLEAKPSLHTYLEISLTWL